MKLRAVLLAAVLVAVMFASFGSTADAARNDNACKGKNKKQCEVPEVPWTLVLPAASLGIAGTYYLVQRRHSRDDEAVEV